MVATQKKFFVVGFLLLVVLSVGASVLILVTQHQHKQRLAVLHEQERAEASRIAELVDQYNQTMQQAQGVQRSVTVREVEITAEENKLEQASVPSGYPLIDQSNRDLSASYQDFLNSYRHEKEEYLDSLRKDVEKAQKTRKQIEASSLYTSNYEEADFCLEATDTDTLPDGAEQLRFIKRK